MIKFDVVTHVAMASIIKQKKNKKKTELHIILQRLINKFIDFFFSGIEGKYQSV